MGRLPDPVQERGIRRQVHALDQHFTINVHLKECGWARPGSGGEPTLHARPLRVDLEHRAGQQRWEHGDERGDSYGELGVLNRQPERHHHASGPERDDPQPQLPSPVQVGQHRREGVFNLAKKR